MKDHQTPSHQPTPEEVFRGIKLRHGIILGEDIEGPTQKIAMGVTSSVVLRRRGPRHPPRRPGLVPLAMQIEVGGLGHPHHLVGLDEPEYLSPARLVGRSVLSTKRSHRSP